MIIDNETMTASLKKLCRLILVLLKSDSFYGKKILANETLCLEWREYHTSNM